MMFRERYQLGHSLYLRGSWANRDMTESPATDSGFNLLQSHAPRVSFDSLEALRPTRVDAYLEGSVIRDGAGVRKSSENRISDIPVVETGVAGPGMLAAPGKRGWMLDPLPDGRPESGDAEEEAEECSDALLKRYEAGQDPSTQGSCYGRVKRTRHSVFLQYWFFYVDNPCVLPPGRHDGDWEFVQLRLTASGDRLTHITVAQHGGPETRRLPPGTKHPEVLIAVGSHASYLTSGTQPKLPLSDECDAARKPPMGLTVDRMPEEGWPSWYGRWGTDRGLGTWLATTLGLVRTPWCLRWLNGLGAGDSPASPRCQHASWSSPARFQLQGAAHRLTRVALRELVHALGQLTWPRTPPVVSVTRVGSERVSIGASSRGRWLRRNSRVAIVFEERGSERVLTVHSVDTDAEPLTVTLANTGSLEWRAAGYNRLRQRGEVSAPHPLEPVQ
jgi:hypothetical protein